MNFIRGAKDRKKREVCYMPGPEGKPKKWAEDSNRHVHVLLRTQHGAFAEQVVLESRIETEPEVAQNRLLVG